MWQGANRSNSRSYCEDLQRRHAGEGAISCFDISGLQYQERGRQEVRRLQRASQRGGHAETLEAAGCVFVVTTLPGSISAVQALAPQRLKWLAQPGHLKKHDPQAARSWLRGRLLAALSSPA